MKFLSKGRKFGNVDMANEGNVRATKVELTLLQELIGVGYTFDFDEMKYITPQGKVKSASCFEELVRGASQSAKKLGLISRKTY